MRFSTPLLLAVSVLIAPLLATPITPEEGHAIYKASKSAFASLGACSSDTVARRSGSTFEKRAECWGSCEGCYDNFSYCKAFNNNEDNWAAGFAWYAYFSCFNFPIPEFVQLLCRTGRADCFL
jgi:hypothetical protein